MPGSDRELYDRGVATLLASWEEYARGSLGAALVQLDGATAAVFTEQPERAVYNNALVDRGLHSSACATAVNGIEAAYAAAGISEFAVWVHESDNRASHELSARGYRVSETTRAMGMDLAGAPRSAPEVPILHADWSEYLRILGVPPGFLSGADPNAFHVLVAQLGEDNVATAMAFDHEGDCGVFNVTTLETARRRGLGTALTSRHVQEAVARGCTTASLQSTPMAERVYAAVGFRDLGKILEFTR
ncbi:MAG: GNAT family N-acetyltransferase [Nocardioidaceae bacterium]